MITLDCEQSLLSWKKGGEERKTSKRASLTVSMTPHATSDSRHRHSHITLTVMLARLPVFILRSSPRFLRKRETTGSL